MYLTTMVITGQNIPSSFTVIFKNFNELADVRELNVHIIVAPTIELIDLVLTRIAFSGSRTDAPSDDERLKRFAQKTREVEKYFGTTIPITFLPHIYTKVNDGQISDVPKLSTLANFLHSYKTE